jgi:hypothetical protein
MKSFDDLTQPEILALAISSEEEDGRIYADFAEGLRENHPDTAHVFSDMAAEENDHWRMLIDLYASKFGRHIPLVRRNTRTAFQVGMAASLSAGISMGFAEPLADDGKLSGRRTPYLRGLVCGLMTFAGGIGHTVPYLISNFYTATAIAAVVVVLELLAIAFMQWRYMDTPPLLLWVDRAGNHREADYDAAI